MKPRFFNYIIDRIRITRLYLKGYLFFYPFRHRLRGKKIYHFIHIGKTGGSAIKETLKDYTEDQDYYLFLHKHNIKLKHIPPGDKVFIFLRHPISRFISAFYSKKRRSEGEGRYQSLGVEPKVKKVMNIFSTPCELAEALSSDDDNRRQIANDAFKNIQHFESVFHYLHSESYFISRLSSIALLGFQEQLEYDFERIIKILDLKDEIKLIDNDFLAHKTPTYYNLEMSDLSIKNLEKHFELDIAFYNKCRNFKNL